MNERLKVLHLPLVAHHEAPEILQPRASPLNNPPAAVAPQPAPILMRCYSVVLALRDDWLDVFTDQQGTRLVAVIAAICNQPLRFVRSAARASAPFDFDGVECGFEEFNFCREAASTCIPSGVPEPSASTISFVPFPLLVFPTSGPPF